MRNKLLCTLLMTAGLMMGSVAMAAEPPMEGEVLLAVADRDAVQAKVEAIDVATRTVKLALPDGQRVEFANVDAKVTHFDTLKVGDKVNVAGSEALAVVLKKGSAGVRKLIESEGKDVTVDGAGVVKTQTVYNDIVGVDLAAGVARIKTHVGEVIDFPVKNKELLAKAAVGDQLVVIRRAKLLVWAN